MLGQSLSGPFQGFQLSYKIAVSGGFHRLEGSRFFCSYQVFFYLFRCSPSSSSADLDSLPIHDVLPKQFALYATRSVHSQASIISGSAFNHFALGPPGIRLDAILVGHDHSVRLKLNANAW